MPKDNNTRVIVTFPQRQSSTPDNGDSPIEPQTHVLMGPLHTHIKNIEEFLYNLLRHGGNTYIVVTVNDRGEMISGTFSITRDDQYTPVPVFEED